MGFNSSDARADEWSLFSCCAATTMRKATATQHKNGRGASRVGPWVFPSPFFVLRHKMLCRLLTQNKIAHKKGHSPHRWTSWPFLWPLSPNTGSQLHTSTFLSRQKRKKKRKHRDFSACALWHARMPWFWPTHEKKSHTTHSCTGPFSPLKKICCSLFPPRAPRCSVS